MDASTHSSEDELINTFRSCFDNWTRSKTPYFLKDVLQSSNSLDVILKEAGIKAIIAYHLALRSRKRRQQTAAATLSALPDEDKKRIAQRLIGMRFSDEVETALAKMPKRTRSQSPNRTPSQSPPQSPARSPTPTRVLAQQTAQTLEAPAIITPAFEATANIPSFEALTSTTTSAFEALTSTTTSAFEAPTNIAAAAFEAPANAITSQTWNKNHILDPTYWMILAATTGITGADVDSYPHRFTGGDVRDLTKLFPEFTCNSIYRYNKFTHWDAGLWMAFPISDIDGILTLEIIPNRTAYFAKALFNIHVEQQKWSTQFETETGLIVTPGPELMIQGVQGDLDLIRRHFGDQIYEAVFTSFTYQDEWCKGIMKTCCVKMTLRRDPGYSSLIHLTVGKKEGIAIKMRYMR